MAPQEITMSGYIAHEFDLVMPSIKERELASSNIIK